MTQPFKAEFFQLFYLNSFLIKTDWTLIIFLQEFLIVVQSPISSLFITEESWKLWYQSPNLISFPVEALKWFTLMWYRWWFSDNLWSSSENTGLPRYIYLVNIFKTWVKWLRMQGHCLPATLEITGSNPGTGTINWNKNWKKPMGFLNLKKSTFLWEKGHLS